MSRVSTLLAAVLGVAGFSIAQSPASGPGPTPDAPGTTAGVTPPPPGRASSPYWNGGGNAASQQQASDLPATDIRTVAVAHANAVRAKLTYEQNVTDLNNAVRLVRMQMDRDPLYAKAVADEKAAYDEAEKARTAVLSTLINNPSYTGAATLHGNVSDQIADEQDTDKPDESKLTAMAKLKLQYVKENRRLEREALDGDAAYQDARKRHLAAANTVAKYRDAQMMAVVTDDTLNGLRKRVADARIEKSTSSVFWSESIDARYLALDYARFYRKIDAYHGYGNGYGTYGYGGGYGGLGGFGYGNRTGFGGVGFPY